MIVSEQTFNQVIRELKQETRISLDTETTGLYPYKGDRLFSIICGTQHSSFYFNFNSNGTCDKDAVLPRALLARGFSDLLSDENLLVYLANAKFDMHMLLMEGVEFKARPWDVLTMAKVLDNTHMSYDLGSVAERAGHEKLSIVEDYIKEHKLYTGNKPRYDLVPLNVIVPYGKADASVTFFIGEEQQEEIDKIEATLDDQPSFKAMVEREIETTKVCFEIEKTGMRIDEGFINRALHNEQARSIRATERYKEITGEELVDSNKALQSSFGLLGLSGGLTKKGNPSFDKKALKNINHELSQTIADYRDSNKRSKSYYQSFLEYASDGVIHPNIHQSGAKTFRFSITQPALQTLEKPDEDSETPIASEMRNAFIAREGMVLVAIDYKQQEYRLTADYAGETALIEKIVAGEDVHTATASLMGVTRNQAKTLNFMLLYGGGIGKLCLALMKPVCNEIQLRALGRKFIYESYFDPEKHGELIAALNTITEEMKNHDLPLLKEAHKLQQKYFSSLKEIKDFIDRVQRAGVSNGFVSNWAGRRLKVNEAKFAYKLPNHLIQSSGAEIMRCALIKVHEFLLKYRAKILLSVHDELIAEVPENELYLIPEIQAIMENVYTPFNGCRMSTDVKVGVRWGQMIKIEGVESIQKVINTLIR